MVTKQQILALLPPFRNERVLVKKNQNVSDIIEQVLRAHEANKKYYDSFAHLFNNSSLKKTCDGLYNFISENVTYVEEPEEEQTTALPSAILSLGKGDCKHYSSFAGGVLDALNRNGANINWCYRFCSYKILHDTPHHVFICVTDKDGSEIWIDPVPGANEMSPTWQLDKYTKRNSMPLYNVVGNTIGYSIGEQIIHAGARTNPLLIAGRGAFLQMVKWNVRAWAKNMDYLLQTKGRAFSDPLGKKWYLLGGRWDNLMDAINEGKGKKMLGGIGGGAVGFTGVEIAAMITAAAPVVIAITSLIKSAIGKDDWNDQMQLPGTTIPGTTTPTTPTTGTQLSNLLRNPIVLLGGAAVAYYFLSKPNKVNGKSNNTMLYAAGAVVLFMLLRKKDTVTDSTPLVEQQQIPSTEIEVPNVVQVLPTDESGNVQSDGFPEIVQDETVYSDPERLDVTEPVDPMFDSGSGGGYYDYSAGGDGGYYNGEQKEMYLQTQAMQN